MGTNQADDNIRAKSSIGWEIKLSVRDGSESGELSIEPTTSGLMCLCMSHCDITGGFVCFNTSRGELANFLRHALESIAHEAGRDPRDDDPEWLKRASR